MRNAFGKAISVEALVKTNQKIMSIDVNPKNFQDAKTALKRAGMKMPVSCRIVIEKGAISVEALVKTNQKIMSIDVNPKNFQDAKTALKRAGMKMPVSCRIVVEKGAELVK